MKIRICPFCGRRPSGKRFCSTEYGPIVQCLCGASGPHPLASVWIYRGPAQEKRLQRVAIAAWNLRLKKGEVVG
jgi:hypothetical protein